MKSLTDFINMKAYAKSRKIPSTIIDAYVERIVFDKGDFTWILNPRLGNKTSAITVRDSEFPRQAQGNVMCSAYASTGC